MYKKQSFDQTGRQQSQQTPKQGNQYRKKTSNFDLEIGQIIHQVSPQKSGLLNKPQEYRWKYLIGIVLMVAMFFLMGLYVVNLILKEGPNKSDSQFNKSLSCINYLAYNMETLQQYQYLSWYGKAGTSLNGINYQPGHFIQRHIATQKGCSQYQKKNNKTVFLSYQHMLKTLNLPFVKKVLCDFNLSEKFTYDTNGIILSPNDYIKGIDCKNNPYEIVYFKQFFIQFKRTVQNPRPSQSEYMNSKKTMIWTFYPKR